METSNLGKIFLTTIIFISTLSFIVLKILGFEIAVIFSICLSTSFIMTGLTGIENIIILTKEDKKNETK